MGDSYNSKKASLQHLTFPPSYFEDEVCEGFFVNGMMKRYRAGELTVLAEIDKICKKHDIPWFIDSGTLLGAVRHHGFIPWDDDVDIAMFRHDLDLFLSVAPAELPNDFQIANIDDMESYDNLTIRITNHAAIDWSEDHDKRFFGCPYHLGIDVFALDGLYDDPLKEKDRKERRHIVHSLCHQIISNNISNTDLEAQIQIIEEQNRVTLPRDASLYRSLRLLLKNIYRECPSENASRLEIFFNIDDHLEFDRSWYDSYIMLPFENIILPAPVGYHHVLRTMFGDYETPLRIASAHGFPCYEEQESLLRQKTDQNPYRFTMTKDIVIRSARIDYEVQISQLTDTLKKVKNRAQSLADSGMIQPAKQLLEQCTPISERISEMISNPPTYADETVIYVCRSSWWMTMERYCSDLIRDNTHTTYVIPIPWYEKESDGHSSARHDEYDLFPADLPLISPQVYDPATRHPKRIIIQFPYDSTNRDIVIDESYFSFRLRDYTKELVYVPCYDIPTPDDEDVLAKKALSVLIEQPAVVFADKIIVESAEMRNIYIDTLISIAGEETRNIWEKKITTGVHL